MEKAVILAEGKFNTIDGKSAHGLVRYSKRFEIKGIIDSETAGRDAGEVLNGKKRGIRIYASLEETIVENPDITHLIIGVATAGGVLPKGHSEIIKKAIVKGLHIINGLHYFLSDNPEFSQIAEMKGVELVDIRKKYRDFQVFFTGKIEEVTAAKVAVLGTDSAIGKRTTAIMICQSLKGLGKKSVIAAMGQTGWMQGIKHCIVLDSIVLDFVTGAIEDVIWNAWKDENPEFIVTHGEGAMLHPACPGGAELIASARPEHIILQHSPMRRHYDDFPMYKMDSVEKNIRLIELYSGKTPDAITINSEGMTESEVGKTVLEFENELGIMTRAPLFHGVDDIASKLVSR